MEFLLRLAGTAVDTALDVAPILVKFVVFQVIILRRKLPNLRRIVGGFVCVLAGLTLFLVGLEEALFPIGETMANQLTAPAARSEGGDVRWDDYLLVYAFAAAIGFATTVAEPSLIVIALKAEQVSGGVVRAQGLRIAVAVGVAVGVSLVCFRIVTGTPLPWYIVAAYAVVIVQTDRASKMIMPLAYDSRGVTTSTVTVPVVAALGLGVAASVPGRSPLIDGFGLIALQACFRSCRCSATRCWPREGRRCLARYRRPRLANGGPLCNEAAEGATPVPCRRGGRFAERDGDGDVARPRAANRGDFRGGCSASHRFAGGVGATDRQVLR